MRGLNVMYDFVRRPSMAFDPHMQQRSPISPTLSVPPPTESPMTPLPGNLEYYEIDDEFNLPISVALVMLMTYMLFGAFIFCSWEQEWTFFESFYFVFISISTIGEWQERIEPTWKIIFHSFPNQVSVISFPLTPFTWWLLSFISFLASLSHRCASTWCNWSWVTTLDKPVRKSSGCKWRKRHRKEALRIRPMSCNQSTRWIRSTTMEHRVLQLTHRRLTKTL